jgi:hypothetical protein
MKRLGFVLILTCLSSGAVLLGMEPAASLEARLKAVAKTFHTSYKTITKLLTSVAELGQIIQ